MPLTNGAIIESAMDGTKFIGLFLLFSLSAQASLIAVVGDTQRTTFPERLIGRELNEDESGHLLVSLAHEDPQLVVLLGDLVSIGSAGKQWKFFDSIFAPIAAKKIPALTVLGNHEYLGCRSRMKSFVEARFPEIKESHWYSRMHGGLALVFLDSNKNALGKKKWNEQAVWFGKTIEQLDRR